MKGLDPTQIEQLKQIAEYLCYQRQEKGISLEKVAKQTFIPLRLLEALEAMQVERLPEPVYIRGFIRRYADVLGLEGMEIANAFPLESVPAVEVVAQNVAEMRPEPAVASRSSRSRAEFSGSEFSETPRVSNLPLIVSGVAAVVVVGAIALGALNLFKKATPESAIAPETPSQPNLESKPAPQTSSKTSQPSPEKASPPTAAENSSTATEEKPTSLATDGVTKSVQLEINLTGSSWVQVIADGKQEFEGTLKKGDQRTWNAQKDIVITAGEAGAVTASCNQTEAKPLGRPGEVVDSTCAAKKDNP